MTTIIKIENIDDYVQEINNGVLILIPKELVITEENIDNVSFANSKMIDFVTMNGNQPIKIDKYDYNPFFINLLSQIDPDVKEEFKKITNYNFVENKDMKNKKGYVWNNKLKMSIQYKNSNDAVKEIYKLLKFANIKCKISIKKNDNQVVYIKV